MFNILLSNGLREVNRSHGKKIDLNVILIMTSNVGAEEIIKEVGFLGSHSSNDNEKAISNFFSPEFRNRLDAIINFDKLSKKDSMRIVDKF